MSNLNKKTKDELLARIFEQDKVIAAVRKEVKDARENVADARERVAKSEELINRCKEAMKLEQIKIQQLRDNVRYWRRLWLFTTLAALVAIIIMLAV